MQLKDKEQRYLVAQDVLAFDPPFSWRVFPDI